MLHQLQNQNKKENNTNYYYYIICYIYANEKRTRTVNHHQERIRAVVCRRHLREKRANIIVDRVQEGPEA